MAVRQRQHEQDPMVRRTNFDAVESNLTDEQAKLEAARCLNCKYSQPTVSNFSTTEKEF